MDRSDGPDHQSSKKLDPEQAKGHFAGRFPRIRDGDKGSTRREDKIPQRIPNEYEIFYHPLRSAAGIRSRRCLDSLFCRKDSRVSGRPNVIKVLPGLANAGYKGKRM